MWVQRKTWVDSCISSYLIVARRSVWGQGENNSKASPCIWGALWLQEGCRWQPPDEGRSDPRGPGLSVGWMICVNIILTSGLIWFWQMLFCESTWLPRPAAYEGSPNHPSMQQPEREGFCFCYCLSNPNNQRWLESKRLILSRFIMMHAFHFLSWIRCL